MLLTRCQRPNDGDAPEDSVGEFAKRSAGVEQIAAVDDLAGGTFRVEKKTGVQNPVARFSAGGNGC